MYDTLAGIASEQATTALNGIPSVDIKSELDSILRSPVFIQSHRIRRFLEFIVDDNLREEPQFRAICQRIGLLPV
jgi:hypothetical protein